MKPGSRPLNVERARQLYDAGYTWAEVGVQLAYEEGRPIAYTAKGVLARVRSCGRKA